MKTQEKIISDKWEKTGFDVKPRFQNIYGEKNTPKVIWIDNWSKGNYAVIIGIEHPIEWGAKYEEKEIYVNVPTKREAVKYLKELMLEGIKCEA